MDSIKISSLAMPRYRIVGMAGSGGMGVVYRAIDVALGRTVALKFLPPMLTPSSQAKMRFLNEARAASALDHPNICTIHEVGETAEGQLYLAMAFYEGETLKQRLERGPLPVSEALNVALQIAHGLAKAHRHGIVHRDIKPANLMITADGIVKVLDFGIARLPDQTLTGPLLGTPGYMSPEQARAGSVDARSDVWSLGIVLQEMLTGWRPGKEGPESSPAPKVPPEVSGLLSRMLAEKPADRYPDAATLLADLSALERKVSGLPLIPVRKRPLAQAGVVAAALAIAVVCWLLRGDHGLGKSGPGPRQATLTPLTDLPGKEWFPSFTPDGNLFVYVRKIGGRNRLFLQQVGDGKALDLLPNFLEGGSQPAISPDGHQIAFRSEQNGGGIFVMGLIEKSPRRVTNFGFSPAWSPDGTEILLATEEIRSPYMRKHTSQIYRVDLTTGRRRLVYTGDAVQPSWSPHGFRIAYWGLSPSGQRLIWTVPASGGEPAQVTLGTSTDWNPAWSPDGKFLYFVSDRSGINNVWRMPIDEISGRPEGDPEPVTTSGQANMFISLSRDGKRIIYAGDETRTAIDKFQFDPVHGAIKGSATTITQTSGKIATLDASRNGQWIVYQTSIPQEDIYTIQSDGSGLRRLTYDRFKDRQPRWSPDGTRIAFYSNRGGKYEIWTVRADGSQLERAAVIPGRTAYHPIWSPDGRWIACDLTGNEALIDLTRRVPERYPLLFPLTSLGAGFSASSWSADGRWLAGNLQQPDGRQLPGIVLYSLDRGNYVRITDRGEWATWLSDSRRLLYRNGDDFFLVDVVSRLSRHVLTVLPDSEFNDLAVSADNRFLYVVRSTEQGDIWMLTLK